MKVSVARFDAVYDVVFSRPAFSRVTNFVQIIEPIHDAFSKELFVPSDAIRVENGNTISTAGVIVSLLSGNCTFEVRLDGYKAHFSNLNSTDEIDRSKRLVNLFEHAVTEFLADGTPAVSEIRAQSWLQVEGGMEAAEKFVRRLTWLPESVDPFEIGASKTRSQVKFESISADDNWTVSVLVEKSALPNADLFLEISSGFGPGTKFNNFRKKADHFSTISSKIMKILSLSIDGV